MNAAIIQERVITDGDVSLFVRIAGAELDAPTLVLLHGGPGVSHDYLLPLAALAGTVRVVFYDQRGVGRSAGGVIGDDPLAEWAEDLESVRRALGAEQLHLLGHSAGGLPAIAYGSRYPGRTASIQFVDSVPPTASQLGAAMATFNARIGAFQAEGLVPADLSPGAFSDDSDMLAAILPVYFLDQSRLAGLSAYPMTYRADVGGAIMQGLGDYDLTPEVARLTMPTISFIAQVPFGPQMGTALYDALPVGQKQKVVLDHCGHFPWIECPEPFLDRVTAFLGEVTRVPFAQP